MSPIHRDGAGEKTAAPTRESLPDRLIREAQERGEWETGDWETGDWETGDWAGRRLPARDGACASELAAFWRAIAGDVGAPDAPPGPGPAGSMPGGVQAGPIAE